MMMKLVTDVTNVSSSNITLVPSMIGVQLGGGGFDGTIDALAFYTKPLP
jgi:hypothetical protein